MNISELLLNIKSVSFDSLVCQTKIVTEDDKEKYLEKGYAFVLTLQEYQERFTINPSCIWYAPSIAQPCIYFNKDTLAAALFPIDFMYSEIYKNAEVFYKVIQEREGEVIAGKYQNSISSLPDSMRLEYFKLLVDKKGADIPGLYKLFFSNYVRADYGFGNVGADLMMVILNSKTAEDKLSTEKQLENLPDIVKVYRGGNSASLPYEKAYSWTLDINTANFFASRLGTNEGYIVEAEVNKKDIIEAFLDYGDEQEVLVNPQNIRIISQLNIRGIDFIEKILPEVSMVYKQYVDKMMNLEFAQDSSVHGHSHQARVLLLALTIAHHLNLSASDKRILATTAIYHDTQRINDETDELHGKISKDYYCSTIRNPDPIVEFLCEFHCLPDNEGYKEIMNNRQLSKNRSKAKLLFDIFKDADALDRVRFGIKALDLKQLRLPISKELSISARMYLEYVHINKEPNLISNGIDNKIRLASKKATTEKNIQKSISSNRQTK